MSDRKSQVKVKEDLLEIKDQIRSPVKQRLHQDEIEQITSQLQSLSDKIDNIEQNMTSNQESPTKLRKKKEIIFLIKQEGKITTSQLSDRIDLSRTRCSEYLNELKKEGILDCEREGRSKYYTLNL